MSGDDDDVVTMSRGLSKKESFICNRVYCIHVPGHDPLIFSCMSFSFLIGWEFYGPNYLRC